MALHLPATPTSDMSDAEHPTSEPLPASWSADEQEAVRRESKGRKMFVIIAVVMAVVACGAIFVWSRSGGGPEERAWPASISGRPAGLGENGQTAAEVTPDAKPGVYLWSGFDGWHLWVVPGEGVRDVKGTITSTVDIAKASLSAPGNGSVTTSGHTVTFDLATDAAVTGVDFEPGFYAKELEVTLEGADGRLSPSVVTLGQDTPAKAVPVVIEKAVVAE